MHHGKADSRHGGRDETSLCYVIGHGIDTVAGDGGDDLVIVCSRKGSATAFLVEDGASYSARTGSTAGDGQILVSADGALIMSLADIARITISAADPGDSLTVAGDFSSTLLRPDGLVFEGRSARVDAAAITSGHRVLIAGRDQRDGKQPERDRTAAAGDLLVFRNGCGPGDEAGGAAAAMVGDPAPAFSQTARRAGELVTLIQAPSGAITLDDGRTVEPSDLDGLEW